MQYLKQFARNEGLLRFLDELVDRLGDNTQGVCLTYDPYWQALAVREFHPHHWPDAWPHAVTRARRLYWGSIEPVVRDYRPPDWDDYCVSRGYPRNAAPIIVKLLLRKPLF